MSIRQKSRVLLVAASVLSLTAALGACSKTSGSGGGDNSLTVQYPAGGDATYQALAKGFEAANPGVKVNLQLVTQEAKTTTNLAVLTAANPPDVAFLPANSQVYSRMLTAGQLVPLDDVWKKADLARRYDPGTVQALTGGNSVPYIVSTNSLYYNIVFYNADLFGKAGIEVPADHRIPSAEALYAMVGKLKAAKAEGLAVDGKLLSWMVDAGLPTTAGKEQLANYLTSWNPKVPVTAKYTDPAFVAAVQRIKEYNDHGVFQSGFLGQSDQVSAGAFTRGDAGMLLSLSLVVPQTKALPFKAGWLLLPPVDPARRTQLSTYSGDALAIPAGAAHKDLAKKFIEYSVQDQAQLDFFVKLGGSLPSVSSVDPAAVANGQPVMRELLDDAQKNGVQPGWTSVTPGGLAQQFIEPLLQGMLTGKLTPDEVARKEQEQLEAVRK
jgi:raffinose/stachyose/melibiose transport system substrate-binding protein